MSQNQQKNPFRRSRRGSSDPTVDPRRTWSSEGDTTADRGVVEREIRRGEGAEVGGRLRRDPSAPTAPEMADSSANRVARDQGPWRSR